MEKQADKYFAKTMEGPKTELAPRAAAVCGQQLKRGKFSDFTQALEKVSAKNEANRMKNDTLQSSVGIRRPLFSIQTSS